jgi:hypothetical protein
MTGEKLLKAFRRRKRRRRRIFFKYPFTAILLLFVYTVLADIAVFMAGV